MSQSVSTSRTPGRKQAGPEPVARRRSVRQFIPPQHGAWAMLVVPWLAAVLTAGFHWLHLPLLGAWLTGYLLSYYAMQAIKTGRVRRWRAQMLVYGPPTVLLGGLVLALRPQLLWFAPAYAALLAVNAVYARLRRERALVNDLASVLQSCLMVLVAGAGSGEIGGLGTVTDIDEVRDVLPAVFLPVLAYFAGTVFYVKTMIRERDSVGYRVASVLYHLLALAAAVVWWNAVLAALFGLLLVRSWVLPRLRLAPKQVGILEIVNSVLLLVAVAVG